MTERMGVTLELWYARFLAVFFDTAIDGEHSRRVWSQHTLLSQTALTLVEVSALCDTRSEGNILVVDRIRLRHWPRAG